MPRGTIAHFWATLTGKRRPEEAQAKRSAEEAEVKQQAEEAEAKRRAEVKRRADEASAAEAKRREATRRAGSDQALGKFAAEAKRRAEVEAVTRQADVLPPERQADVLPPEVQKGIIICQNPACLEQYDLSHIVTVSDDDAMNFLLSGGATVIGRMSGHPVLVGHSKRDTTDRVLGTLLTLQSNPRSQWTCDKCKADNEWGASYRRTEPASSSQENPERRDGTQPAEAQQTKSFLSILNELALAMQDAFEAHMKRARSNTSGASASAILDNISVAFQRSAGIAGTFLGNALRGVDQDVATIVFYADLQLRFGVTIFKSSTRTPHTYFAKYGGYMEWIGNNVLHPDLVEKARQKDIPIFAHLIFVIDYNNKIFAHLCVVPNGRRNNSPLTLLPVDLLTEQERNMLK